MRIVLVFAISISLGLAVFGQETKAQRASETDQSISKKEIQQLPLPKRGFKPKLTLQAALKLAESYIEKEKIDIASFYLLEARLIQYGSEEGKKEPRWFLWWVNENGQMGNYIEITVSMNGKIARHPSM